MSPSISSNRNQKPYIALCGALLVYAAAVMAYTQTVAFAWDEGFHLLAAQLIMRGERPYLDFFFPQTPLNAMWVALCMKIFGDTWRTAHSVAGLEIVLAVWLTADFVWKRFPVPTWRVPATYTAAALVGLNVVVTMFGTVAQAYGFALVLTVAAFRATVPATERSGIWLALLGGFFAGAASAGTLLSAPVGPVLLVWLFFCNQAGNRWLKAVAFCTGVLVAFSPLIYLFTQNPKVVWFNIFEYHAYHREEEWSGAIQHDLKEALSWIDSAQSLVLIIGALAGLFFVSKRSGWPRETKRIFWLCAFLIIAVVFHVFRAHPTFSRYTIFTVPFVSMLAVAGLYDAGRRLADSPQHSWFVAYAAVILVSFGQGKSLYEDRESFNWILGEQVAKKVDAVSAKDARILAMEHVYFITRRQPPEGFEHSDAHKLKLSKEEAKRLHVVSQADVDQLIKARYFDTIQSCDEDEDRISELGLKALYGQSDKIDICTIYWEPKR